MKNKKPLVALAYEGYRFFGQSLTEVTDGLCVPISDCEIEQYPPGSLTLRGGYWCERAPEGEWWYPVAPINECE